MRAAHQRGAGHIRSAAREADVCRWCERAAERAGFGDAKQLEDLLTGGVPFWRDVGAGLLAGACTIQFNSLKQLEGTVSWAQPGVHAAASRDGEESNSKM